MTIATLGSITETVAVSFSCVSSREKQILISLKSKSGCREEEVNLPAGHRGIPGWIRVEEFRI
jgi:hypothetical protein